MKLTVRPFIIAEAGVNHNGSLDLATALASAAREAGADAVKFQTFSAVRLATRDAAKAAYQRRTTARDESQLDMLRRLELDGRAHRRLMAHCRRLSLMFLSSPFDERSADLLADLGVTAYKIGSGEITNLPFLRHVARKRLPILLSTGMATLAEVARAMEAIHEAGGRDVTLLHCVTEYPAPIDQVNLRAMSTLEQAFHVPVGYSDHTPGFEAAIAATALGAAVIEKHLTLDRSLPGPDHKASLEPHELAALVQSLRNVAAALGDGVKRPARCELKNRAIARKSLVAARPLKAGQRLGAASLAIKRPGTGIEPADLEKVIGRRVRSALARDQVITWNDLA